MTKNRNIWTVIFPVALAIGEYNRVYSSVTHIIDNQRLHFAASTDINIIPPVITHKHNHKTNLDDSRAYPSAMTDAGGFCKAYIENTDYCIYSTFTTDRDYNLQTACDTADVPELFEVKIAECQVDTDNASETAGIYAIEMYNLNNYPPHS